MRELPDGTVTFLLTDVEGSTALWEQAPDEMRAGLARHDDLFEAAIHQHSGVHIRPRGEGDSRFAVFSGAPDAVAAALMIQRTFAAESWPTPTPIRVRIGVHTGEAQLRDGDYYGVAVNRCARLRGIGHGGQTLLSEATAALVRDDLADDVSLVDLGAHRLKDLTRPERVFQVSAPDLPTLFRPLASLDARPHNLPLQTTSLLGRGSELDDVRTTLFRDDVRLVTLTGPGGTGKTRLALQAAADLADHFVDGVFFVDLAPVIDPERLVSTIAPVLGIAEGSHHLLDDLKQFLHGRTLLLLLDNFEHLLTSAPVVSDLLMASPNLKMLVTSRAPLQLRAEHEITVPPLSVPDLGRLPPVDALDQYSAIALFLERAQAVHPAFTLTPENAQAVTTICAHLDGLPLALELAAARIRVLTPDALVARLDHRLPLLTGGPRDLPARQRTLRDTIAWSYDLLDEPEQRVFRALSVFVGGFTLEAAESVLAGQDGPAVDVLDAVSLLVVRSLVRQTDESSGEPRFGLLETIREFGLEQLEANGELERLRDRHLAWVLGIAERTHTGNSSAETGSRLDLVEAELDNVRAALFWGTQSSRTAEPGLQLALTLCTLFWTLRGYHREGRTWLERLLPYAPPRSRVRGMALLRFGYLALRQNDYAAASPAFTEALAIWQELGDRRLIATVLRNYGTVRHHLGEFASARQMLEESLQITREEGDRAGERVSIRNLADLHSDMGEYALAAACYEKALALARADGDDHDLAYALRGLGHLARAQGQYARAEERLRESLVWLQPLRDRRCIALSIEGLACITVRPDWPDRAARLLGSSRAMQARTGAPSPPFTLADYKRTVADARHALGEEQFEAAWTAGMAMGLDEAVELALAAPVQQGETAVTSSAVAHPLAGRPSDVRSPAVGLSRRELEVVASIAQGLSNRQIAEQLVLSVRTVERHIENVYNRLGISGKAGRAIVTAYALRHQLIEQPATR